MTNNPPQPGAPQPYGVFESQSASSKKSKRVLIVVLSVAVAVILAAAGLAFALLKNTPHEGDAHSSIDTLVVDYKSAEDAKDTTRMTRLLCSADVPKASEILDSDMKVAPGRVRVTGVEINGSLGWGNYRDSKQQVWTFFLRKEAGRWAICPSAEDDFFKERAEKREGNHSSRH